MIYVFIITNEAMKNKNWRDKIKIQGGVGDDKLYRKLIADQYHHGSGDWYIIAAYTCMAKALQCQMA